MIVVEEALLTEQEEQEAREYEELCECEELNAMMRRVVNKVEDLNEDYDEVSEYSKALELVKEAWFMVMGRAQELDGEFCTNRWQFPFSIGTAREREAMSYARQEGVNYVALSLLTSDERVPAVDYIREHGLASMSYMKTLDAVKEYTRAAYEARTGMNWPKGLDERLIP